MSTVSTEPEPTRSADPASSGDGPRRPDTHHADAIAPATTKIRRRVARHIVERTRVAVVAVLAATTLAVAALPASAVLAPSANAASTYWILSPFVAPARWQHGDCYVYVGPKIDQHHRNGGFFYAGAIISCRTYHSISATVRLQWWNGQTWVDVSSTYYSYYTYYVEVDTNKGVCGRTTEHEYWREIADVTISGIGSFHDYAPAVSPWYNQATTAPCNQPYEPGPLFNNPM